MKNQQQNSFSALVKLERKNDITVKYSKILLDLIAM
jgi:hypothetical protein